MHILTPDIQYSLKYELMHLLNVNKYLELRQCSPSGINFRGNRFT